MVQYLLAVLSHVTTQELLDGISRHNAAQSLQLPQHIIFILSLFISLLCRPSYRLSSYGRRTFSVAGPMTWNLLPRHLRDPIFTPYLFLDDYFKKFLFRVLMYAAH